MGTVFGVVLVRLLALPPLAPFLDYEKLIDVDTGSDFAMQEAILAVAVLFQKFDFKLKDPNYILTWKQTLTLKPRDLFMYAKLRSDVDPLTLQKDLFHGSGGESIHPHGTEKMTGHSDEKSNVVPLSIFYGSNTGTCESLASRLAMTARQHGFSASIQPLDEAKNEIPNDRPVVMITSTMYEGHAPGKYQRAERLTGGIMFFH